MARYMEFAAAATSPIAVSVDLLASKADRAKLFRKPGLKALIMDVAPS